MIEERSRLPGGRQTGRERSTEAMNAPGGTAAERVAWTRELMPTLIGITEERCAARPFIDVRIGVCLHLEPKTAVLLACLRELGAEPFATGNFGTTQDDVVGYLNEQGLFAVGRREDTPEQHLANKRRVLEAEPHLLLDNGAELYSLLGSESAVAPIGGTEETTTGGERLRDSLDLGIPVVVINDSPLKRIFENEIGVGQSVLASFQRVTNSTPAGKEVVVLGYGWCGRGIANAFRSTGARVSVVDVDPVKAFDAAVHGYAVRDLDDAVEIGGIFVTATGRPSVLPASALRRMRDGAIVANAGHFGVEIDLAGLDDESERSAVSAEIERFRFSDGRSIFALVGGEMLNLAGGAGNPIEPMDMGLALQLLSLEWVLARHGELEPGPRPVPDEINEVLAARMLTALRPRGASTEEGP